MKNLKWLIWPLSEAGNMAHHFEKQILRMSLKTVSTSIPQLGVDFQKYLNNMYRVILLFDFGIDF